jgi:hypothetical protein
MANLKKQPKYFKKIGKKLGDRKVNGKAYGDCLNLNFSSEEEESDVKAKVKHGSSLLNIKEIYVNACYSEPIFLIEKKKFFKLNNENIKYECKDNNTEISHSHLVKKKNSNTFTEITKLSDTDEFDKAFSSVQDSWLQYRKSSVTSISSEFKNNLTFNSLSDSDESIFDILSTKANNKKVLLKKVKFDLNNLINII